VSRTNIDLDDALVARVMERYGLKTKKEAVDLALRRLVGGTMTREEALAMEGAGWDGDLQMVRRDRMKQLWDIEPEESP
jgi:Arc/MetJ family transcription regulator